MTATETGWRLVPRLLLRRAGFSFDLLEELADPAVGGAAEEYRDAESELSAIRGRLLQEAIPAAVVAARRGEDRAELRSLSAIRSAVGRRRDVLSACQPPPTLELLIDMYRAAHARLCTAQAELLQAMCGDRIDRPQRVRKALSPELLDAILQLAPSCYDGVQRWLGVEQAAATARDRAMLRRMYLYCQRLAAKNETTSFFGPIVHGVVDPGVHGVLFGEETRTGVVRTRGFVSFWAVCELARQMALDPQVRASIPISWVPANRLDGEVLTLAGGRQARLDADQVVLVGAVDGVRSATELAAVTGQPAAQVAESLRRLERLGVVRTWHEPSSTAVQPFEQLLADARRFAGNTPWPERLSRLWALVERFAAADDHQSRRVALDDLEQEFSRLADTPARRAGGQMYADRMVGYLESQGDLGPVRLGADIAATIESGLGPVLDLGSRYGDLLHRAHQQLAGSVLRAAGTATLRYDDFVARIGRAVANGELAPLLAPVNDLTSALTTLVHDRLTGQVAALHPADLRQFGEPDRRARFASPDLLIRQADEGPTLVLGEVHPYVFGWGSQGLFSADPDGLAADFAADLSPWGGREAMATVVRRRRHKGLVAESFPGRFVEVTSVASRCRQRTIAITDLVVEADRDGVRLKDAHGELVLYAGEGDHAHLLAFAPPPTVRFPVIRIGDLAPRVVVGSVVAQRAGWWVQPADLFGAAGPSGAADFLAVQRFRASRKLPRWVYAQVAGEPKPFCVDLDSPLAVEAMSGLVRAAAHEPLLLREMLPEPGALWLRKHGRPVTSEWRLAMVKSSS